MITAYPNVLLRVGRMLKKEPRHLLQPRFLLTNSEILSEGNAMRGYHYLMRMAHSFNTLARFFTHLTALYREKGVRGAIHFIRQTCAAPWLNDKQRVWELLNRSFRLQFE